MGLGKAPTTKLPPVQAGRTGKIVVMLSSVAKAPTTTQQLPTGSGPVVAPPKIVPQTPAASQVVSQPPPLPPKTVTPRPPATPLATAPPQLTSTTFVKLPPKTAVPAFVTLAPKPAAAPVEKDAKVAPPLLPPKQAELKKPEPSAPNPAAPPLPPTAKTDFKKTGPIVLNPKPLAPPSTTKGDLRKTGQIKLNPTATEAPTPEESIFAEIPEPKPSAPKPEGWKKLQTGEIPIPPGGLKNVDAFERSQRLQPKPPPVPTIREKPAVAPPLTPPRPTEPPTPVAKEGPSLNPAPVSLPSPHPLNIAPPMVEKAHDEPKEKLPQPHLSDAASLKMPEAPAMPKAPEMTKAPEMPKAPEMKSAAPSALPPPLPTSKPADKEQLKKSAPIVLKNTSRIFVPGAKPALRPAVLPSRASQKITPPVPAPEITPAEIRPSADRPAPPIPPQPETTSRESVVVPPVAKNESVKGQPAESAKAPDKESKPILPVLEAAAAGSAVGAAVAATPPPKKPFTPPTRAERAKKRRVREIAAFWVLAVVTTFALYFGILHFGRDTRVEGQVIPPDGMTLNDEVWIVSDFSSLAAGVADDLAKERVPLQQEIQEAQDHVQRVQADIASREERIRLIQQEIQATKDQINNIVKKSRDDTQAIWDTDGAEIDQEYEAKLASLKQTIADRAASLKLQYAPDPNYPSPEVWANAYRLALYEVPAGVDGAKEHQWLSDQMKQWRDFEKSLDDRKEQLREKAAQLKLAPASKLADLTAKIDDLNQRVTGTQSEEEPLKGELAQAQSDLTAAQNAESSLDDKYYGQLYSLPSENISYHIPVQPDGRFTWVPDNPFGEGEVRHLYWIFSRATRADGRQYWALQQFPMEKNKTTELTLEPPSFESTKQILRPNLTPAEIEQ
jgi:predicted  nucleic acid-binding Zn-ribbon protein